MNNKYITNNKKNYKTYLIAFFLIVIIIGCAVVVYNNFNQKNNNNTQNTLTPINLDPATEEEQSQADAAKDKIVERQNNIENQSDDTNLVKKTATVVITDAAQYDNVVEVRSFMPDFYEDGTCTISFKKGTLEVKETTPAYRDAKNTTCTNPLFERSRFTEAGDWVVSVTYESLSGYGKSDDKEVTIK